MPAASLRTVPAYYRGVDPVIDHDHGNPPGLLNHSEAKPKLPPVGAAIYNPLPVDAILIRRAPPSQVAAWEKVASAADQSKVKCLEVDPNIEEGWCSLQCNTGIAGACPAQYCLCDWEGKWPTKKDEFSDWDLGTLGISNHSEHVAM